MFNSENGLLTQTRPTEYLAPVWLTLLLSIGFVIVGTIGGGTVFAFVSYFAGFAESLQNGFENDVNSNSFQTSLLFALSLASTFGGIYIVLGLWGRFVEKRSIKTFGLIAEKGWFKFGRGFVFGLIIMIVPIMLLSLFGFYTFESTPALTGSVISSVFIVLLGWLVQGPAEELVFRGWVLPIVTVRYNKLWLGLIVSAGVFAFLHSLNPNLSILAILNLFLFGLFAAFYSLFEESIWGVCGIHAAWNWAQGNILGLEVSGTRFSWGSLMLLKETGPDWLTGGAFGPEGGLMVTLVFAIGIGILFYLDRFITRQPSPETAKHQ